MNPATGARWHRYADNVVLAADVAQRILQAAHASIRERGIFRVVLAGGATPKQVYAKLVEAESDWARWEVYFGDERCLPPDDPERNSFMADRVFLDRVAISRERIHPIPAELGPQAAAEKYRRVIETAVPFDLVLLGLGEDGHTASLFPGHAHPGVLVVPVHSAPKPPSERVSLTASALSNAHQVFFLVTGANKRGAVEAWWQGERLPAATIAPAAGVDVFVDAAAWPPTPND